MQRIEAETWDPERESIMEGLIMMIDNKTLERMERGTLYRTIYKIEGITAEGDLVFRLFARNRKTALKIKRANENGRADYIGVDLVPKFDHRFILPWDVD